jgi:hypothetical protein
MFNVMVSAHKGSLRQLERVILQSTLGCLPVPLLGASELQPQVATWRATYLEEFRNLNVTVACARSPQLLKEAGRKSPKCCAKQLADLFRCGPINLKRLCATASLSSEFKKITKSGSSFAGKTFSNIRIPLSRLI